MAILGNLVLAISVFLLYSLLAALYSRNTLPGGDAGVSYIWGIIFLNLAFFACLSIVAIIIGWKGGFSKMPMSGYTMFIKITGLILISAIGTTIGGFLKNESSGLPSMVQIVLKVAPIIIPSLLLILAVVLLNDSIAQIVPLTYVRYFANACFGLGVLVIFIALLSFLNESNENAIRTINQNQEDELRHNQQFIKDIESCDVTENLVAILVLTDSNHNQEVRTKAINKIKTNPNWQQELIRLMNTEMVAEVFTFLASNSVENVELFREPIRNGIVKEAEIIKKSIKDAYQPHHLYADQFVWDCERILRTVDKFQTNRSDYLAEIRLLRNALEQKAEVKKPNFNCTKLLDNWIKNHE